MDLSPLTALDRCDAGGCSAQARCRAWLPSGNYLLFCRHHALEHENALLDQGAFLDEQYDDLEVRPGASA